MAFQGLSARKCLKPTSRATHREFKNKILRNMEKNTKVFALLSIYFFYNLFLIRLATKVKGIINWHALSGNLYRDINFWEKEIQLVTEFLLIKQQKKAYKNVCFICICFVCIYNNNKCVAIEFRVKKKNNLRNGKSFA